jgi:uncharacterized membrane protein YfcA
MAEERDAAGVCRDGFLGFVLGIVIGAAAGLVGVGGGEFRIPVLLNVLRLPLRVAAGVNLLVGLFTVTLSVGRRWGSMAWSADSVVLAATMGVASLAGAVIGARQAHRLPIGLLKKVVCVYVLVVGFWMVVESLTHAEHTLANPQGPTRWVLAGLIGFAIAVISGSLGVAGGEMRIPALLYLFALPIKQAGTISLLVSIPTVASGALAYRRLGHLPKAAVTLAVLMGLGSLIGVLIGASLLNYVDKHAIKGILGVILLLAAVGMVTSKGVGEPNPETPPVST